MVKGEVGFIVTDEYMAWIEDVKKRIKSSQIKASVKVNNVVLDLYRNIGKDIVEKQAASRWGDGFLSTMSKDLKKSFPNMSGFSVENLKSMRYWYKFYNSDENGLQAVSQIELIEKMEKAYRGGIISGLCISVRTFMRQYFISRKHWITVGAGLF